MIDLGLTPLQAEILEAVREAAAKQFAPTEGVTAMVNGRTDFDVERWTRLAELGWFSLGVPEADGGLGLATADELRLVVELGRVAAAGPFIGTILAARAAAAAGDTALVENLVSGARRAGIVVGNRVVDAEQGDLAVRVTGTHVDLLELGTTELLHSVDPLARVVELSASTALHHVADLTALTRLRVLTGGYLVGLAQAATEMSTEYGKVREQFGKPIGSFQAVKHRCAEMVIRSYPARAQLATAAFLVDESSGGFEAAGGLLLASDAAVRNAADNVQNHGGIGFTAEHPAGVLVKRVLSQRHLAGNDDDLVDAVLRAERTQPS